MPRPPIVRYTELPPQPWKNGKGITRTLFSDATKAAGDWTWKISIAEITGTQPYSPYPGVRRGQVALGPGAVELVVNGQQLLLPVEGTIVFDGEDDVSATPESAGFLDLNIMGLRDMWEPSVEIVQSPVLGFVESSIQVLIALEDTCAGNGQAFSRLDSLLLTESTEQQFSGRFVLATLTKR